jgi:FkbM family methyltransferase
MCDCMHVRVLKFMLAFGLACAQPHLGEVDTVVELRAEVEKLKEKVKQLEAAPSVVPPGIYPLLREWGCGHHNLQVPKLLLPSDGGAGQWVVDIGLGPEATETLAAVRSGFVVFSFEPLLANIQSIRAIVAKSSNTRKVTFLSATWIVAAARHGVHKELGGAEGGWTWQAVDALGVKVEARSWASVSAALSDLVASRAGNKASGQAIIVHAALDATPGVAFMPAGNATSFTESIGNTGRGNGLRSRLRVPKLTLDDALPWKDIGAPPVHFIKIDTQGWELKVLKGAMQLLAARRVRYVLYEYSPWLMQQQETGNPLELLELLPQMGAVCFDMMGTHNKFPRPSAPLAAYHAKLGSGTNSELLSVRAHAPRQGMGPWEDVMCWWPQHERSSSGLLRVGSKRCPC